MVALWKLMPSWARLILLGMAMMAALYLAVANYLSQRDATVQETTTNSIQAERDRDTLVTHERIDNADSSAGADDDGVLDWLFRRGQAPR